MKGFGGNLSKIYLKANMFASEAVSNIRTYAAFWSEDKIIDYLYSRELEKPSRSTFFPSRTDIWYLTQFFLFLSYGLALWYESVLMGPARGRESNQMAYVIGFFPSAGVVELEEIHFHYPSRPDIIIFEDFNLKVKAEKSMALVGSSGSGKSTVISLLLRFYDPTSGKVLVCHGRGIKQKSLRKHIGLVQQEPALFATTIYENIIYGKDGATEA
ncbi:hypothetical protein ZOSMA_96G00660 [Zostera marina]|uniref:ABC transporter domain-containing protein n=1 Tax=Zostera marina TaxID=29655 RepID=A0A0K9NK92_ZOSMR|nr:hypothetical protein ZOSMA_96G00660 [Zostera marina]